MKPDKRSCNSLIRSNDFSLRGFQKPRLIVTPKCDTPEEWLSMSLEMVGGDKRKLKKFILSSELFSEDCNSEEEECWQDNVKDFLKRHVRYSEKFMSTSRIMAKVRENVAYIHCVKDRPLEMWICEVLSSMGFTKIRRRTTGKRLYLYNLRIE